MKTGTCIATWIGGMLLGSVITMLVTPRSGREVRSSIRKFVNEEMEKVRCKCDEMGHCDCNDQ